MNINEMDNSKRFGGVLDHLLLDFNRHVFQGTDDIVDQASLFVRRH